MLQRLVLLLSLTTACGRIGYDPLSAVIVTEDGGSGEDASAAPWACPAMCACEGRNSLERSVCRRTVTWSQASTACTQSGLRLVQVDDSAENTQVRESARRLGIQHLWLGGTDAESEGIWRWSDGTVFFSARADAGVNGSPFTNWARLEPNDVNGGEDCVLMLTDTGVWNDATCDSTPGLPQLPWGYACEKP